MRILTLLVTIALCACVPALPSSHAPVAPVRAWERHHHHDPSWWWHQGAPAWQVGGSGRTPSPEVSGPVAPVFTLDFKPEHGREELLAGQPWRGWSRPARSFFD